MSNAHKIDQDEQAPKPVKIKSKTKGVAVKEKKEPTEKELERNKRLSELSTKYARNARDNGEINRFKVLAWLLKWGWTTNQIIQRILEVQRPRPADEFVRRGLLEKIESKRGWIEKSVYILSPAGVAEANRYVGKLEVNGFVRDYTLHITKRIPWLFHEHHITAQHLLIDTNPWLLRISRIGFFQSLKTDYELDLNKSDGVFIADFVVDKKDEEGDIGDYKTTYYEVELTEKKKEKMWKWAWTRAMHLKKNPGDTIVIFSPHNRILANYKDYFSEKIPKPSSFNGKPSADPSQGIYLNDTCGELYLERLEYDDSRKTGGYRSEADERERRRFRVKSKYKPAPKPEPEDDD